MDPSSTIHSERRSGEELKGSNLECAGLFAFSDLSSSLPCYVGKLVRSKGSGGGRERRAGGVLEPLRLGRGRVVSGSLGRGSSIFYQPFVDS